MSWGNPLALSKPILLIFLNHQANPTHFYNPAHLLTSPKPIFYNTSFLLKKKKKNDPAHEIQTCQPAQSQQLFERIVLEAYSNDLPREHHNNPGYCSNFQLFVKALF